ncbi:hypothetical protein [Pontibacter sp. G13]|uniref:hypothetical protein n=1 Tax=Pontibacter sp. G13 TaxID=3074898 RepID=UPI0028892ED8|nr:hypothetical protein [Pontibacter sp. G13]WNJ21063.1 hypothetical protein RJD25_11385 [Pontibacter sp. G13]
MRLNLLISLLAAILIGPSEQAATVFEAVHMRICKEGTCHPTFFPAEDQLIYLPGESLEWFTESDELALSLTFTSEEPLVQKEFGVVHPYIAQDQAGADWIVQALESDGQWRRIYLSCLKDDGLFSLVFYRDGEELGE